MNFSLGVAQVILFFRCLASKIELSRKTHQYLTVKVLIMIKFNVIFIFKAAVNSEMFVRVLFS